MGDPQATYDRFDAQIWRDKLEAELSASGLPAAIQKLTIEMVDSAKVKTLLGKADTVMRQLREMSSVYECVLLRYSLPSYDLVPVDENAFLRQRGSKANMTPQHSAVIKRVKYPKPFRKHGVG